MRFNRTLLTIALLTLAPYTLAAEPAPTPTTTTPANASPATVLPLDDLRTFVDVFERIRASYVDPVDDKTLFENAIRGMLTSLDPHSAYLDKKDFEDMQSMTSGEFEGVGLDIGMDDGVIRVISPVDDSPAAKAGIRTGDLIIKIDGKAVQGISLSDAVNLMRGKSGTKLLLTVMRKGEDARDIELIRARVEVSSVRSRELAPGIFAVRISQFQIHTGRDLRRELDKIKTGKTPVQGIILDLRNNPGGVVDGAIATCDLFLDDGIIVSTRGREERPEQVSRASAGEVFPNTPMVVLVNGGSASASEIVAGALQDNHRALIMGTTTFGKGSVQTILPISNDRGIKLTTSRYYTPSGRSIQAEGIKPDIEVLPAKVSLLDGGDLFHEADLQGHLANPNASSKPADSTSDKKSAAKEEKKEKLETVAEKDYQMSEAITVLKAAALMAAKKPVTSSEKKTATEAPAPEPAKK